jgi:hypothetical protein
MDTSGIGREYRSRVFSRIGVVGLLVGVIAWVPAVAEGEDEPAGEAVFLEAKCNVCHAVPAAAIEAKAKSEKMRGPALGGPLPGDMAFEGIAAYLRKQAERDGAEHKKEFKGSDEELHSILDWLGTLEAAAVEG